MGEDLIKLYQKNTDLDRFNYANGLTDYIYYKNLICLCDIYVHSMVLFVSLIPHMEEILFWHIYSQKYYITTEAIEAMVHAYI